MFKRVGAIFLSLVLVFALVGCSSGTQSQPAEKPAPAAQPSQQAAPAKAAPAQDPLQTLYEAAKAEGEVDFRGPTATKDVQPLMAAFEKRFPGVKVKHHLQPNEELVQQVLVESRQNKVSFDVVEGRMSVMLPLFERDLILGFDDWSKIFKDLNPNSIQENGRLLWWYSLTYPIAFNTDLVKSGEEPKSWDDLLQAKWKGKIMAEPRANAFAYLGLDWGKDKMVSYLEKLRGQELLFVKGGTTVAAQTMAGQAPVAVGTYDYMIRRGAKDGGPIDWVKTISPVGATMTGVYTIKGSPHPNAARLWAGWLASEEGVKIQLDTLLRGPVYKGSVHPFAQDAEKYNVKIVLETAENFKQANEYSELAAKTLGVLK